MKIKIVMLVVGALLAFTHSAESGAAVAMRNKKGGGAQHSQPPQLPPGYRMGPNGVEKIPEAGENEGADQEATESDEEEAAEVKDVVDANEIIEALQTSSQSWELIISRKDKQAIVEEFIKQYASEGVTIQKPAEYYANFIDEMAKGSPEMLSMPFKRVLQIVTVMEYDFDDGHDKDQMAQKVLGPQVYEKNKQRLMKSHAQQ